MRFLNELKKGEAREKLILSAFTAFQLGAGGDKNFGEYLKSLGLSLEPPGQQLEPITKEEAIAKAERIKESIRKTHANKGGLKNG